MRDRDRYAGIKKIAGLALILTGAMFALYPIFTYLYSWYAQERLRTSLAATATSRPPAGGREAVASNRPGEKPWAVLDIPAMHLSAVVVEGTSGSDLMRGPGWFRESAPPGRGNTAIAGHRTMYGGWFYRLNRLRPGDTVMLAYGEDVYRYRVERVWLAAQEDWSVIAPCGYTALTLVTCSPSGDRGRRLVARARLDGEENTSTVPFQ